MERCRKFDAHPTITAVKEDEAFGCQLGLEQKQNWECGNCTKSSSFAGMTVELKNCAFHRPDSSEFEEST